MAIQRLFNGYNIYPPSGMSVHITTWIDNQTAETVSLVQFLAKTGGKQAQKMLLESWRF